MAQNAAGYDLAVELPEHWVYTGDIDPLGNGGCFIKMDPADLRYGFVEVIDVVGAGDLPDGERRGCEVQRGQIVVHVCSLRNWRSVYQTVGAWWRERAVRQAWEINRTLRRQYQIEAIKACYGFDQEDGAAVWRTNRENGLTHLLGRLLD